MSFQLDNIFSKNVEFNSALALKILSISDDIYGKCGI